MKRNINKYLSSIFISESFKDSDFQQNNILKTALRGINFTSFIVLAEFIMILVSFFVPSFFQQDLLKLYRYHYIALFSFSIVIIIFTKYLISKQEINYRLLYISSVFAVIVSILWSGSISLLDLLHTPQISVYLTFVVLMAIGPILTPRTMVSIYISIQTLFIIAVPYYQNSSEIIFSTRLNSSLFIFFAWLISRQLYKESYLNYKKDKLISKQTADLKSSNERLLKISRTDPLTSLYNRLSLDDILNEQWITGIHNNYKMAVLMIDVDAFKLLNDTYGHIIGDKCLIEISQILQNIANIHNGFAFRYGGDEFCLIFNNSKSKNLSSIISSIKEGVDRIKITMHQAEDISLKLSIGYINDYLKNYDSPWDLIKEADSDLYIKKSLK